MAGFVALSMASRTLEGICVRKSNAREVHHSILDQVLTKVCCVATREPKWQIFKAGSEATANCTEAVAVPSRLGCYREAPVTGISFEEYRRVQAGRYFVGCIFLKIS